MKILKYVFGTLALVVLLGATTISQLVVALNNADLTKTPASPLLAVPIVRFGYTSVGDAPPLWWWRQSGTCASHSMVSDGGSCQNGSDGNSFYSVNQGFVDPRQFGSTCGSGAGASTWNQNNSTNDDTPGFNAALATGLPVVIPFPGCKWVTQVAAPVVGATVFSFGGGGPYDALTGSFPALTQPYIFVPDAASTSATSNCIFDTKGLEGVTWRNVTIIGNNEFNGTSAFCNSVGIANGRPQAFATLDNVSITNMAGIGGATNSQCQPTGSLDSPVFQLTIRGLKMGHDCFGVYANYSDVNATDIIMGNLWNACWTSPAGGGISLTLSNMRCEYTGHFDANPIYNDGIAFYISSSGFANINNVSFDHIFGACMAFDGNNTGQSAGWTAVSNIRCKDAGSGGAVADGGVINNPCNFLFENQAINISAIGMTAQSFTNQNRYNLCFAGTQSEAITWLQTAGNGPNLYGGWRLAFTNGTLPAVSKIEALAYGAINNDTSAQIITYPTTCSGQATGTTANISGFLKIC